MQGKAYVQGLCVVASSEFIYCLLRVSFHYVLVKWVPAHCCNGVTEQEKSDLSPRLCVCLVHSLILFLSLVVIPPTPPTPSITVSLFLK